MPAVMARDGLPPSSLPPVASPSRSFAYASCPDARRLPSRRARTPPLRSPNAAKSRVLVKALCPLSWYRYGAQLTLPHNARRPVTKGRGAAARPRGRERAPRRVSCLCTIVLPHKQVTTHFVASFCLVIRSRRLQSAAVSPEIGEERLAASSLHPPSAVLPSPPSPRP